MRRDYTAQYRTAREGCVGQYRTARRGVRRPIPDSASGVRRAIGGGRHTLAAMALAHSSASAW
eukprot:1714667-Rhodomonas_salina.1